MTHGPCKSHYVSHLAAFFIVRGTKISDGMFLYFFSTVVFKRHFQTTHHSTTPHTNTNDPAAGSPTATLLWLKFLLLDLVRASSPVKSFSLLHSLQHTYHFQQSETATGGVYKRKGLDSLHADDMRLLGIPRSRIIIAIFDPHYSKCCKIRSLFQGNSSLSLLM